MSEQLLYGDGRSLRLAWRHPIDVVWCAAPRIAPVANARLAARRAVEAPVDYPPLSALLAPEDRVAIAVEPGVPEAAAIVQGVIDALSASGVQRGQVAVVRASAEPLGSGVREVLHRATDADSLAYLAATDDAHPIYLNRVLYDADLVIPIGLRRPNHSYGYLGSPGGIYPLFSDAAAQFRLLPTSPGDWRRHGRARRWEADRVAWQLGVQFRIEAVPGAHGQLAHVVGGQTDSVTRHTRRWMLDAWGQRLSQQVGIAVAAIENPSSDLVWEDIQRAFYTAARLVGDQGVIVVCSNVDTPPLPVLRPATAVDPGDPPDASDEDVAYSLLDSVLPDESLEESRDDSPDDSPDDSSWDASRDSKRKSRGRSRAGASGKSGGRTSGGRTSDKTAGRTSGRTGGRTGTRSGTRSGAGAGHDGLDDPRDPGSTRESELHPVRELLAELGESRRLYLMSDLPRDLVEELGCMPVETDEEIVLLARPFDTGVVIANAEYAHLSLAREEE